ncbi:potassium/proton antiporter [Marivibrio halodurans]|uniref:potassium/proton antiporter n=1 Tax=Marivibrio halodurans TaxID=2039722 RepID=UPI001FE75C15|nr:potassium/proton antiporter [Marivibrio halodurans]
MESADTIALFGALTVLISVLAGAASTRFGAPMLLVFLIIGMLVGEDGPGNISFDDYHTTYLVGSIALAIILFDGGLRTRWPVFRGAAAPASLLATLGVLVTAGVTALGAYAVLDVGYLQAMLIGAIVSSTDAAAVFLILSGRGVRIRERLRGILEAEAGLNDPVAVLLTTTCVSLIQAGVAANAGETGWLMAERFVFQIAGGLLGGLVGGAVMLMAINRMAIASGLYPIMAASAAVLLFAAMQQVGASGFLAVYLAGLVVGSNRHRATYVIMRFHDGLAWLCQIVMFLMLGLLVTPSSLVPLIVPALAIGLTLILVARPVAVLLCAPFLKLAPREGAFLSWVGLRGAVPIFLGTIPVLAGLEDGDLYFGIVYIVVLLSLVLQGWSVGPVGRRLNVLLAPRPEQPPRVEIDMPSETGRVLVAYSVQPQSLATRRTVDRLPLPADSQIVSILRDGQVLPAARVDRVGPGDDVLVTTVSDALPTMDRLFGARPSQPRDTTALFRFPAATQAGAILEQYGEWLPPALAPLPIGELLTALLRVKPREGARIVFARCDLVVTAMADGAVTQVGLEPALDRTPGQVAMIRARLYPRLLWGALRRRVVGTVRTKSPEE